MKIIKANKEELFDQFEFNMMETTAYLDTKTGKIVFVSEFGDPEEDAEVKELLESEPERFVAFPEQGSKRGYDNMVDFTNTVKDNTLRNKLAVALKGRGAFRRFKDALLDYPDEQTKWFEFEEKRRRERFEEWLESTEIKIVE